MLTVGVTGGIGSGKTTVCRIFEVLGIPVYYADDRAKQLMQEDDELIAQIKKLFGEEAYQGQQLNRPYIAQKVFNNKILLNELNNIVHPAVFRDATHWMQQQTGVPYAIEEAALLFETGSYKKLDKMITVHTSLQERIQRLKKRDNATYEEITARMKHQWNDEDKIKLADFVIYNDGDHSLIKQVLAIHYLLVMSDE